jgi:CheY-like chemotaxis protein/anti-sigma regulatory factor (Ser/Thr protein kinase)
MASILLADDSQTHTVLMRRILERGSHSVTCVADGQQALDSLQTSLPDLVVTDLQMPVVNGMELVSAIADQYPSLPSIVVTTRGSESLAVDALAKGAANFVPKSSLGKLLLRAVRQTIQFARVVHAVQPSGERPTRHEWTVTLRSDPEDIEPLAWLVIQTLAWSGHLSATDQVRVGTAIASGMFNAMCFGNLQIPDEETVVARILADDPTGIRDLRIRASDDQYRNLTTTLMVSIGIEDTRISIRHSGHGRATRMTPAPGTPESFEREQCRGLMLISSFMDEVILRSDASEVVMVKQH